MTSVVGTISIKRNQNVSMIRLLEEVLPGARYDISPNETMFCIHWKHYQVDIDVPYDSDYAINRINAFRRALERVSADYDLQGTVRFTS